MWILFTASWNRALVARFLVLLCMISQATPTCPDPKTILPCLCTTNEQEIQVWCGQSELSKILEALKSLTSLNQPIDELILENNLIPSLPGQAFMPLKIVRLMIRDNGLERVSSNWLLGLETSLLELYLVEPELRSLPDDSLSTLPKLEAITLNVGGVKQLPSMAGLARLRYIYIQAPEVTEITSQLFISLPYLEQIHVVSSPKITKLDQGLLSDLPRLALINITRCGLSWLHPRAFARLPSLVELSLIGNRFSSARIVGTAIRELPVLTTVRLDENEITQVEEGAFIDIPSLRHLSLTYNRIIGVQRGSFYRTPLLRSIDLSHNQVQLVHAESFIPLSDDNVEEMRLAHNNIEHAITLRSILDALPRLRLLDLSHNRIVDILFGTLRGHPTLEILQLNDNQIARIGREAISGMPLLRELNLRNNSLTSHLDFPIWSLPSLKGLDLSHNRIRRLDRRVLANLPSLRRVDLSYNTLAFTDPGSFLGNPALEIVNMSHNSLVSLSHAPFAHLINLYELDVSFNRLKEFIIGLPQGLEYLRIARNQITAFPRPPAPEMNLVNLKFMDISGNGLHHIPSGTMKSLQKLRWLNVGDNALTTLEEQALNGLSSVEALDLRNNRLLSIHPTAFSQLQNLGELSLRGNRLETIESSMLKSNPRLKRLDLSRNQISDINPMNLLNNKEMEELYIANNALSSFPESLSVLPNLHTLDLSYNRLQRMAPSDLANITNLSQLHLARNKLRTIKENSFYNLPNLMLLDLESNDLEFLSPHAIRSLPRLKAVSLARNKLTTLPSAAFSNLPELQTVELQENLLSEIASDAFTATPSILMLNLSHNQLSGMEKAGLEPLRSIELLDMSSNLISHFSSKAMPPMDSLVMLKLDSNRICGIEGNPFNHMSQLRYLSIRDNKMTSFPENTFGRLRTNIASLDIEGNPLRCSCGVLWLQAWLRESSQEGPRCADGSLLRDFRLERQECQEEKQDPGPGCPPPKAPPGSSQSMSAWNEINASTHSTQRPFHQKPLPEDTDYFDEGFVDIPFHKVPSAGSPQTNNNHSYPSSAEQSSPRPPHPSSSDIPPDVLSHYIPGDTPTLYAGTRPHPPTNSHSNPHAHINNATARPPPLKNNTAGNAGGTFSFFGVPIPPLNLGNFWSTTRNDRGRFNDGRKSNKGPITNGPTNGPVNGPTNGPIRPPPNPPEIQEGGFIPMLPGGNRGFKPIVPVSTNVTMTHRIKNYEKASINYTTYEIPKRHHDYDHDDEDQLGALTDHSPAPPFAHNSHSPPQFPSNNSHKQNDIQTHHNSTHEKPGTNPGLRPGSGLGPNLGSGLGSGLGSSFGSGTGPGPVRRPIASVIPTEIPRRETETGKRNNENLIDLIALSSTPSSVQAAPQPTSQSDSFSPIQPQNDFPAAQSNSFSPVQPHSSFIPVQPQSIDFQQPTPTSTTVDMLTNLWNTFVNEKPTSGPSSLTGFLAPGGQLPPFDEKTNTTKAPVVQSTGRPIIQKVNLSPPLRSGPSPQAEDLHSHPRLAKSPAYEPTRNPILQTPQSTSKTLPSPSTTSMSRPRPKFHQENPRYSDNMNWYFHNYNNSNLDPYVGPNLKRSGAYSQYQNWTTLILILCVSFTLA